MNTLIALFGALLQASSFTLDKAALNVKKIDWQTYTSISFPLLVLFDALFLALVRPDIGWSTLGGRAGVFVLITVAIGFITNALYYRALDDNYLQEIQTWGVFLGIPTIILNGILFTDERRFIILIPTIIAITAVTWANIGRSSRLVIRPKTAVFILWMLVAIPVLAAMNKIILRSWNPILLELFRDTSLALIFFLAVSKGIRHVNRRAWSFLLATNLCSSAAWIIYFYSFQRFGVIQTALYFSVQPILVYLFSLVFLREPFVPKKVFAFVIVLACIVTAQVLQ